MLAMLTNEQRIAVAAEAKSWIGTDYHHHARLKGCGVDCANLLIGVYHNVGLIPSVDPGRYPTDWHLHRSEERFKGWVERFAEHVPLPDIGDVGLWRFGRCFSHGGIFVGDDLIVHAYIGRGVIESRLNEEPLAGRIVEWWSVK
jgi:NlpC/P60 family putative phage cell wall peptidase